MRCLRRDIGKAGIALLGILLLVVLMMWHPMSVAGAYEGASGIATPITGTPQVTPTEDATVVALNKEKLQLDINKDRSDLFWAWTASGTIVVGIVAAIFTFLQFLRNQQENKFELLKRLEDAQIEREKRAEERFQTVVEGLGSERTEKRIGAAVVLRTFLRPDYEQFYRQTFDLAVANLRLPRIPDPPQDSTVPLTLTTLSQTLIVIFKEAFPLVRGEKIKRPESLDASGIQLDNAYLRGVDLKQVWMPQASLRKANFHHANLSRANLNESILIKANFSHADLSGAALIEADLREATLSRANLNHTSLIGANFSRANLHHAALIRSNLSQADLSQTNIEDVFAMKDADLRGVKGLTREQLEACRAKGAIIDENTTTSSSQLPVSSPKTSQSNDEAPQTPSAQESNPTPEADGSSTVSSEQEPES